MHRHRIICHWNASYYIYSLWFPTGRQLLVSLRKNCLPIMKISTMDLSHAQTWTIGRAIKINIPVCQQWLLHLRYILNSYSVCVVTSVLARETVQHWSTECIQSQTGSIYENCCDSELTDCVCWNDLIDSFCNTTLKWSDWRYVPLCFAE